MRFKGCFTNGLFVALILTLIPITAFSAQKITPGSTCKIYKQKVANQNKVYACIKSGKKLVWNKGVAVKKPTPIPIETPSPSPSPSPTESMNSATKPIAVPSPTFKPVKPISLDNLDIEQVQSVAYENIIGILRQSSSKTINLNIVSDRGIPSSWISEEKERLNVINTLLNPVFQPQEVNLLYWLNFSPQSIEYGQNWYDKMVARGAYDRKLLTINQPNDCSDAFAQSFIDSQDQKRSEVWMIVTCAGQRNPSDSFKIIHEYFHLLQWKYHVTGPNQSGWLTEGSADYYGQVLGLMTQSEFLLRQHRRMLLFHVPRSGELTEDEFVETMKTLESDGFLKSSYYLGSLATEVLVAIYGHQKFMEFLIGWEDLPDCRVDCRRVENKISDRMVKHFGISATDFYRKLYPYFRAMSDRYRF